MLSNHRENCRVGWCFANLSDCPVAFPPARSDLAYVQRQYATQVAAIGADLRALADWVDHETAPRGNAISAAGSILARIHNALPNLPLGLLLQAAGDLERLKSQGD